MRRYTGNYTDNAQMGEEMLSIRQELQVGNRVTKVLESPLQISCPCISESKGLVN